MKAIVIIVFAIIATTLAAPQLSQDEENVKTIVSGSIKKALENLKEQLRTGFPNLNIPPLAPFEHAYEEINVDNEFLTIFANISDLRIEGIDNYDVKKSDFQFLGLRLNVELKFHNLHINRGIYSLKSFIDKEFNGFTLYGDGDIDFAIENSLVTAELVLNWGWTSFSVDSFNINLKVDKCKSNITGLSSAGISTDIINRLVNTMCQRAFIDHKNDISKALNDFALPQINDYIRNISYWDIIGWILGLKK